MGDANRELAQEMESYTDQLLSTTRAILRQHADKVEALVEALMAYEELNAEKVAAILGPRLGAQPLLDSAEG